MKKILGLSLLIVSINSFGQNIPGYQTRQVREKLIAMSVDSGLHIPRYNGTPTGIRNGVYVADGAIAMDTTNHRLYIFSGGVWNRIVNISDTSVAFNPSLTTNLRLQKIIDSLNAAGVFTSQRFGKSGEDVTPAENRSVDFTSTYTMGLRHMHTFTADADSSLSSTGYSFLNILRFSNRTQLGTAYRSGAITSMFQSDWNSGNPYATMLSNSNFFRVYADSLSIWPNPGNTLRMHNIQYNSSAAIVHLGVDTTTGIIYRKTASGGSGSNFANADLTFTGNRFHELDDNQLEIANQGGNQLLIDPVNRRYGLGDIPATGNGRSLIILDTATVTDGYKMPAMQEATTSKVVYYNTTTGGLTYDDAPTGTGTVTDFTFTDGNGFDGTVANSTTTPALSLNLTSSFEPWYTIYSNFGNSSATLWQQSFFGSGATIGTLTVSTIFDGWQFGQYMETGTTTTGSSYNYAVASGNMAGIAISNSFRYNIGAKVRLEDLSDGTDTYNYMMGFADDAGNGVSSIVDGIYFEYTHSLNSGNWTCTTESNGTKTQTDSGVAAAADTDYKLDVSVYNGNAFFYINNTLVATHTTNIPTGTARATSIANSIAKSAGIINRKAYVEYLAYGKRSN